MDVLHDAIHGAMADALLQLSLSLTFEVKLLNDFQLHLSTDFIAWEFAVVLSDPICPDSPELLGLCSRALARYADATRFDNRRSDVVTFRWRSRDCSLVVIAAAAASHNICLTTYLAKSYSSNETRAVATSEAIRKLHSHKVLSSWSLSSDTSLGISSVCYLIVALWEVGDGAGEVLRKISALDTNVWSLACGRDSVPEWNKRHWSNTLQEPLALRFHDSPLAADVTDPHWLKIQCLCAALTQSPAPVACASSAFEEFSWGSTRTGALLYT